MTKVQVVEKIIGLCEEYYSATKGGYREPVKNDLRDYLLDCDQDLSVALFEEVKRRHPTQFKEPPCQAVFDSILIKFRSDIDRALQNNGQGIRLKALLRPRPDLITDGAERKPTPEEKQEVAERLAGLRERFSEPEPEADPVTPEPVRNILNELDIF